MKTLLEFIPLVLFFGVYKFAGLMQATLVLMLTSSITIFGQWIIHKKVPFTLLFTTILIVFFGGLTLYFNDERFIKLKPTIVNVFFASILLVGYAMKKGLLQYLFGGNLTMSEEAWRTFSLRWALFFIGLACLNEAIWRNLSTNLWVQFKVFGLLALTLLFTLSQLPFLKKHSKQFPES